MSCGFCERMRARLPVDLAARLKALEERRAERKRINREQRRRANSPRPQV